MADSDHNQLRFLLQQLDQFLTSVVEPEWDAWQSAQLHRSQPQRPSALYRAFLEMLRRRYWGPGSAEADYFLAASGLLSAYHWLLIGGAIGYFPFQSAVPVIAEHVRSCGDQYREFLRCCRELYPEGLVAPVQTLLFSDAGDPRVSRDQREALQPAFQTAVLLAEGLHLDPLVRSFFRMVGFASDDEFALFTGQDVSATSVADALMFNIGGPSEVYVGFLSFVQYYTALGQVCHDLRQTDGIALAEREQFIRLLHQTIWLMCNIWQQRSQDRLKECFIAKVSSWTGQGLFQGFDYLHVSLSLERLGHTFFPSSIPPEMEPMPLWHDDG